MKTNVHVYIAADDKIQCVFASDGDLGDAPRIMSQHYNGESIPLRLKRLEIEADARVKARDLFPVLEVRDDEVRVKDDSPADLKALKIRTLS